MNQHYYIVMSRHYEVAKCGMEYDNVVVNVDGKMAAKTDRFKMATSNARAIIEEWTQEVILMLMLVLGLDWSRLHW